MAFERKSYHMMERSNESEFLFSSGFRLPNIFLATKFHQKPVYLMRLMEIESLFWQFYVDTRIYLNQILIKSFTFAEVKINRFLNSNGIKKNRKKEFQI